MRNLQAMRGIGRAEFTGLHYKRTEGSNDGQEERRAIEFAREREHRILMLIHAVGTENPKPAVDLAHRLECGMIRSYSSTLSSNFFLPQSAAACTNANTSGCGLPGLEESCG